MNMADDMRVKKKIRGGPRKYDSFDVCKQTILAEGAVRKCFDFDCGCDPNCFWLWLNDLPDPYETVQNLRAGRFTGQTLPLILCSHPSGNALGQ